MRNFWRYLFAKPLRWVAIYFSARPRKEIIFRSLTHLYDTAIKPTDDNCIIVDADASLHKMVIFSDQHKGNKTWADDFLASEKTYMTALRQYNKEGYTYINLGDCEELWKFKATEILPNNEGSMAAEAAFHPDRYFRTFGNHDVLWKNKLDVQLVLKNYFKTPLKVYEGIIFRIKIGEQNLEVFLTHGHQGDLMSDNNSFSTWVVAHIWMPIQRYLRININVPSKDYTLRNEHNQIMHEWSSLRDNLLLITGHTHQPVFASGRYFNHPGTKIRTNADEIKPCYFNAGCCCFSDGDITGIEISDGMIRLVKWQSKKEQPERIVLEEMALKQLLEDLKNGK